MLVTFINIQRHVRNRCSIPSAVINSLLFPYRHGIVKQEHKTRIIVYSVLVMQQSQKECVDL